MRDADEVNTPLLSLSYVSIDLTTNPRGPFIVITIAFPSIMSSSASVCSSFENVDDCDRSNASESPAPPVFASEESLKIQQLETKNRLLNAENEFRKGSEMIDEEKIKSELSGGWKLDQKCLFELLNNRESLSSEKLTKELSDQHLAFDNDQVMIFSKLGDNLFDMETRTLSKPSGEEDSTVFLTKEGMVRLFDNGKQETWKIDDLEGRNKKLVKKITQNNGDQAEKVYQKVDEDYEFLKETIKEDKPVNALTSKLIEDFTGLWRSEDDQEFSFKFSQSENLFQWKSGGSLSYTSYVLGEHKTICGSSYISRIEHGDKICTEQRLNGCEEKRWERSVRDGKLIIEFFVKGEFAHQFECERVGEPLD